MKIFRVCGGGDYLENVHFKVRQVTQVCAAILNLLLAGLISVRKRFGSLLEPFPLNYSFFIYVIKNLKMHLKCEGKNFFNFQSQSWG